MSHQHSDISENFETQRLQISCCDWSVHPAKVKEHSYWLLMSIKSQIGSKKESMRGESTIKYSENIVVLSSGKQPLDGGYDVRRKS